MDSNIDNLVVDKSESGLRGSSTRRTLSANVQKLRFMQLNTEKKVDLTNEGSNKPGLRPAWIVDEQAFNELAECPEELQPKTFAAEYTTEKVALRLQHRLSFHNYNPTVERFQKLIAAKANRSGT